MQKKKNPQKTHSTKGPVQNICLQVAVVPGRKERMGQRKYLKILVVKNFPSLVKNIDL